MTRTARPPARRRRASKGEGDKLKPHILDATERLLVETGDEERVSIRAIAEAVGVTPPSIYRHFEDKEELVTAVCERRFASLNAAFESAVADVQDPTERLISLGRSYARFALEHPEHYRLLMMTASPRTLPEEAATQGPAAFGYLVDAVAACQAAGSIPPNEDPRRVAIVMWSGVHGLASLLITRPHFDWPAAPGELIELVLAWLVGKTPPPVREV